MPVFPIERDSASAEFLDGTKRGEFLLVRDTETGEILSPQFDVSVQPDRYTRVIRLIWAESAAGAGGV